MDFLVATFLGLVEGLTEFLPVSSTGHLIIAESLWGFEDRAFAEMFMVVIQGGAIMAVVLQYARRFLPSPGVAGSVKRVAGLWVRVIAGFLPFAVLALLFQKPIKALLFSPVPVAVALIVWGAVIILVERFYQKRVPSPDNDATVAAPQGPETLSWGRVVGIGLFQCLALVPGTSRSAATIVGGLGLGLGRIAAAEFSFFLAIPTLLAASGYEILDAIMEGTLTYTGQQWAVLAWGTLVSFAVAWGVIRVFMDFIRRRSFTGFGWYRIALGVVVLLWFGLRA